MSVDIEVKEEKSFEESNNEICNYYSNNYGQEYVNLSYTTNLVPFCQNFNTKRFERITKKGRRLRTIYNSEQKDILNYTFRKNIHPKFEECAVLAGQLGVTTKSVRIWFQNERAKMKRSQKFRPLYLPSEGTKDNIQTIQDQHMVNLETIKNPQKQILKPFNNFFSMEQIFNSSQFHNQTLYQQSLNAAELMNYRYPSMQPVVKNDAESSTSGEYCSITVPYSDERYWSGNYAHMEKPLQELGSNLSIAYY